VQATKEMEVYALFSVEKMRKVQLSFSICESVLGAKSGSEHRALLRLRRCSREGLDEKPALSTFRAIRRIFMTPPVKRRAMADLFRLFVRR
jgi:hypothetical protein